MGQQINALFSLIERQVLGGRGGGLSLSIHSEGRRAARITENSQNRHPFFYRNVLRGLSSPVSHCTAVCWPLSLTLDRTPELSFPQTVFLSFHKAEGKESPSSSAISAHCATFSSVVQLSLLGFMSSLDIFKCSWTS